MKKSIVMAALVCVAMGAGSAAAYERYDNAGMGCVQCHAGFEGGNANILHAAHVINLGITQCNFCHPNGAGSLPVRTMRSGPGGGLGCAGCHGQDHGQDSSTDGLPKATAKGLRLFHASKGVMVCAGCHAGSEPVANLPEDDKPPYYLMPGSDVHAACDSTEEDFADGAEITPDSKGLDNDGNGFADFPDDPNCGPATTTTSTTSTTTTTLPLECPAAPAGCLEAAQGKLNINEKVAGKEKMKASLQKLASDTAQADFGDPVDGDTVYILCVYNSSNTLVADYKVKRAGEQCGDDPCWVDVKTTGYKYQDKEPDSDGIAKIQMLSGEAGKGKIQVQGKNSEGDLPTGIAAAMSGQSSAVLQFFTSNDECFGATLSAVKTADGIVFQAATP